MGSQEQLKEIQAVKKEIYKRLSPAIIFADLRPVKDGGKYRCICPECKEATLISEMGTGKARCSGQTCTYSISFWDYLQKKENLDSRSTYLRLCQMAGLPVKGQEMSIGVIYEEFLRIGKLCLLSGTDYAFAAREYLQGKGFNKDEYLAMEVCLHPGDEYLQRHFAKRRVPKDMLNKSGLLGIANVQECLLLPIRNESVALSGFALQPIQGADRSYLESFVSNFAKGSHLYSIHLAAEAVRRTETAIIVDRAIDVCYFHAVGFKNALSLDSDTVQGVHIDYLTALGTKEVVICKYSPLDVITESIIALHKRGILVSVVRFPEKYSSASSYIKDNGVEAYRKLMTKAMPGWSWVARAMVQSILAENMGIGDNVLKQKVFVKAEDYVDLLSEEGSDGLQDFLKQLSAEIGAPLKELKSRFLGVDVKQKTDAEGESVNEGLAEGKAESTGQASSGPQEEKSDSDDDSLQQDILAYLNAMLKEVRDYRLTVVIDYTTKMLFTYRFKDNPAHKNYKFFLNQVLKKAKALDYTAVTNLLEMKRNSLQKEGSR